MFKNSLPHISPNSTWCAIIKLGRVNLTRLCLDQDQRGIDSLSALKGVLCVLITTEPELIHRMGWCRLDTKQSYIIKQCWQFTDVCGRHQGRFHIPHDARSRKDSNPRDLVLKSNIVFIFGRRLFSGAAETPANLQSNRKISTLNLVLSRFDEILVLRHPI